LYSKDKVGAVKKKAAAKKKAAPKKKAAVKKLAPVKAAPVKTTIKKYNSVTTVSGVKKAASKKVTGSHKDTKSHNVNIRVVSGTERDFKPNYLDPKSVLNEILFFQNLVTKNNEKLKKEKNIKIRAALRYEVANNKKWIATNKKQLKELLNKLK